MKIGHREQDVEVIRHSSIAEALLLDFGYHENVFLRRLLEVFRVDAPQNVDAVFEPLTKDYENEHAYRKTCALASLETVMSVHDFYRALEKDGYYPASVSEGLSYLSVLKRKGVEIGTILHLGTFVCDEDFQEQRLLTKGTGRMKLIGFPCKGSLKAHYQVVVIEKEKKA